MPTLADSPLNSNCPVTGLRSSCLSLLQFGGVAHLSNASWRVRAHSSAVLGSGKAIMKPTCDAKAKVMLGSASESRWALARDTMEGGAGCNSPAEPTPAVAELEVRNREASAVETAASAAVAATGDA
ncbi:MAG: hypothetical protein FRX49_00965 [Trebouxia sp. A1-2]|nr:MAG: hypothetical protein FRX49_00965 [Trebouxia sp. A1-2]